MNVEVFTVSVLKRLNKDIQREREREREREKGGGGGSPSSIFPHFCFENFVKFCHFHNSLLAACSSISCQFKTTFVIDFNLNYLQFCSFIQEIEVWENQMFSI